MRKWPHIDSLPVVRKSLERLYPLGGHPTVPYKAKPKLDGSNAAVRKEGEKTFFQSRTLDITPNQDNAGFARWASGIQWPTIHATETVVIHGEWAGKGIQKGTSVSEIEGKKFFIFAVEIGDEYITDPQEIATLLGDFTHPDVYILPWYKGFTQVVDFNREGQIRVLSDLLNLEVLEVEACDPYVKETFGISGVGEGLVLYPLVKNKEEWARFAFKAKGEKHRVKAAKVAVEVEPEVLASVDAFVQAFVTEARCQQGLTVACGGDRHPSKTGAFIGWMGRDIERESAEEVKASGLTWKQVSGPVANAARKWFLA